MNALGWMQRKFRQNNGEQSRNISKKKAYSCFSGQWGIEEHQNYPEEKNISTHFRQPRVFSESSDALDAKSVEDVNEEEMVDMSPEFFHSFLAIGTLGSLSTIDECMTPENAMKTEVADADHQNELQSLNKLEKINEKEVHGVISNESPKGKVVTLNENEIKGMETKANKSIVIMCPLIEYSEMLTTKEEASKQNSMPAKVYKKSETHAMHFMKKMLKKLDCISGCSPTSANFFNPTEKKPTKVFRKSRKIHPEATDHLHVTKSHKCKVKNRCYDEENDKEATVEDDGMLKKEIVSCYPTAENAHWIKTDADYFVLEF